MTWNNTSASQATTFHDCQRKWFYQSIEKPFPKVTTESQQRGKDIHKEGEYALLNGEVRDSDYQGLNYRRYAEALIPYMPPAQHPDLIVEHEFLMPTLDGLPPWKGFIDHGISAEEPLAFGEVELEAGEIYLGDIKTLSDFRYARTEQELKQSTQMISYARWAYDVGYEKDFIKVGHLYIKTTKKRVPKNPKVLHRVVDIDKQEVDDCWGMELETLQQMKALSVAESAADVPPTGAPYVCQKYGGCEYRKLCGQEAAKVSKGKLTMGFLKKVNTKATKATKSNSTNGEHVETDEAPEVAPKKNSFLNKVKAKGTPKAPQDGQVLPDDAPSREVEEEEEKTVETTSEEKETKSTKRGRPKGATNSKKKFVLYINCAPLKGTKATLFEEFMVPVLEDLTAYAKENDLPHFRMADFSTEKVVYAEAIKAHLEELPPRMIVRTGGIDVTEALAVLRPHATEIVEGLR